MPNLAKIGDEISVSYNKLSLLTLIFERKETIELTKYEQAGLWTILIEITASLNRVLETIKPETGKTSKGGDC